MLKTWFCGGYVEDLNETCGTFLNTAIARFDTMTQHQMDVLGIFANIVFQERSLTVAYLEFHTNVLVFFHDGSSRIKYCMKASPDGIFWWKEDPNAE